MTLKNMTIAVDAMGGDHGPSIIVPAAMQALSKYANLCLILVGDRDVLADACRSHQKLIDEARLIIQHASQRVEMDELPASALRMKKDSSMRVAINLVKEQKAQACVSAGNTGALMATARFVLKTLPGIDRPAIISTFPTIVNHRNIRMLDLGANVDSTAENLFQFAVMGSVIASAMDNISHPKLSLLNIGEEDIKGNEQVKQAALLLAKASSLNYVGFTEGDELFKGEVDVVICDGFVGNVALKTIEGTAIFIGKLIKRAFHHNLFTKLAGLLSMPVLKLLSKSIDPDRYNGASFVGLRGIVIKSHGNASVSAFTCAIEEAILQIDKNILQRISAEVERVLQVSSSERPHDMNG